MVMVLNAAGVPAPTSPEYQPYHNFTQDNVLDERTEAVLPARRPRQTSAGTAPVVTMRQSTISTLRASATIIVFRVEPRPCRAFVIPLCQTTIGVKPEKAPRQPDHGTTHPHVSSSRKAFSLAGDCRSHPAIRSRIARNGSAIS
jgi:hypothetical protein